MTLATIIADVCAEVGVSVPTSIIGNTDGNVVQMLRILNREGKWLARASDWQVLRKESSFTTLAANLQVADLTSFTDTTSATIADFDRFVPKTIWDRTEVRQVHPASAQAYQSDKANAVGSSVVRRFVIRGNALYFTSAPVAGNQIFFEYIKKYWCQSSGGTGKTSFTVDTDTGILDEDLLTQGTLWRFLKAKELDYAEEFNRYERMFSALTGQQMPAPDLSIVPVDYDILQPSIPETLG